MLQSEVIRTQSDLKNNAQTTPPPSVLRALSFCPRPSATIRTYPQLSVEIDFLTGAPPRERSPRRASAPPERLQPVVVCHSSTHKFGNHFCTIRHHFLRFRSAVSLFINHLRRRTAPLVQTER